MRVLVCGGRDFGEIDRYLQHHQPDHPDVRKAEKEFAFVWAKLDESIARPYYPDVEVISGCANGPDDIAILWGDSYGFVVHKYPANWDKYGKSAGYIRNKQMLDEGHPDLVIAFPGGKGTKMMVELSKKAGVEVIEVMYKEKNEVTDD